LAPKEKRTITVEYIVQYPSDYTQRGFFGKGKGGGGGSLSDPFGSSQLDGIQMNSLQIQLKNLEQQF